MYWCSSRVLLQIAAVAVVLKDEPNDEEAYRFVLKWGRAIRDGNSVVKVMVVEQTSPQNDNWGDLYGAVDIWCPLFPRSNQPARRSGKLWARPSGPIRHSAKVSQRRGGTSDYPLLNYRLPAWISWRYRIRGLLYWGGMSHWRGVDDPWTQPETYSGKGTFQLGKKGKVYNGERDTAASGTRGRLRRDRSQPAIEGPTRFDRRQCRSDQALREEPALLAVQRQARECCWAAARRTISFCSMTSKRISTRCRRSGPTTYAIR